MVASTFEAGRFTRVERQVHVEAAKARRIGGEAHVTGTQHQAGVGLIEFVRARWGAAIGVIAGGPADSVACDSPLCKQRVAATSAAARARNPAGYVCFAQSPLCTDTCLQWTVIGGDLLVSALMQYET